MDYKSAGVDVEAGRHFVERIRTSVEATHRPEVLGGLGGFGGLCRLPAGLEKPLLVAGTNGVGTKLELAQECGRHHGVGIDLVAMCANDVITCGAEPLFFLDYIATGKLSPAAMAEVVEGIASGCSQSGCSLLGGETAEMPGFYPAGRYDLAGFCVAVVDEPRLIDGQTIQAGDQLLAIASSGVHSNGFSLVRRILEANQVPLETSQAALGGRSAAEALLEPTLLYAPLVKALLQSPELELRGMAHITGGGLPENLPRAIPDGLRPVLRRGSWPQAPAIAHVLAAGAVDDDSAWDTFNMGLGMCLVMPQAAADRALSTVRGSHVVGRVEPGPPGLAWEV